MKKVVTTFLSYALILNLFSINKIIIKPSSNHLLPIEVSASLLMTKGFAQADALNLSARSKNSEMAQYYLPMLAMLGVGIMSIMFLTKLAKKSADFYMFLIGSIIYLVSVITSWSSEKGKFEKLPESIARGTQVETLKEQKKAYEEVLKMVEKRLMLQGATTAAYLAGAILAGVMYSKNKATLASGLKTNNQLLAEIQSKCRTVPQFTPPNGVAVHATTMEPIQALCARLAAQGAQCLAKISANETNLMRILETMRSAEGSASMNDQAEVNHDDIAALAQGCFDAPFERAPPEAALISYSDPYLKDRLRQHYYVNGVDLTKEKELIVISDGLDLKATDLVVKLINELVEEAHAAGAITVAGAITKTTGNATEAALQFENFSGENWIEPLTDRDQSRRAMDICNNSHSCNFEQNQTAYLALAKAETGVMNTGINALGDAGANYAAAQGAQLAGRGTIQAASALQSGAGAVSRRVASNAVAGNIVNSGASRVAQAGVRVATRAATGVAVRVIGAGAVAVGTAVSAPIIVTAASIGLAVYTGWGIMKALSDWSQANERVAQLEGRTGGSGGRAKRRKTRRSSYRKFLEPLKSMESYQLKDQFFMDKLISVFLKDVHASTVASAVLQGVNNQAVGIAEEVASEAEAEADSWVFSPKGRMVLFGSFSTLAGLITLNTSKMKKNIEEDINKIQDLITEYEKVGTGSTTLDGNEGKNQKLMEGDVSQEKIIPDNINQSETEEKSPQDNSALLQIWNGLLGVFINEAMAKRINAVGVLPLTIPCLAKAKGKCFSTKAYLSRMIPRYTKFPITMKSAMRSTAKMGDMVQRKNYITQSFLDEAEKLNSLRPQLEKGYDVTKKVINAKKVKQYQEKAIPFKKLEKSIIKRFLGFSESALEKNGNNVNLLSILGPGSFNDRSFPIKNNLNEKLTDSFLDNDNDDESNDLANKGHSNGKRKPASKSSLQPDESYMESEYKDKNLGVNTRVYDDIFKQVSKRYMLWFSRQEY